MSIRILLADDHPIIRQGVKALLEREGFPVIGEAADGSQALKLGEELRPDVVVIDVGMPLMSGIDVARELILRVPSAKVVLLTLHEEDAYVLEALRAGVHGYVLKSETLADLVRAIREVCRGGTYLSPGLSRAVIDSYRGVGEPPDRPLKGQEREMVRLIAGGRDIEAVAEALGLSVETTKILRTRLLKKLGLRDSADLIRFARRTGLHPSSHQQ